MAKSVLQIVIESLKKGQADKETIVALKQMQEGLKTLGIVAGAATGIYVALDKTVGDAVRTYMAYADQVRQLSQVTNLSAEETSKLIQVTDDFKVSQEGLTMASRTLSKQGLSLNIETLAELSDQFVKLNSGQERSKFLMDNFGKSGVEFSEIMTQGGAAIRDANAAMSGGLVLNQQALVNARKLEMQQDSLNDKWTEMKVIIGRDVVPALIDLANAYNAQMEAERQANDEGYTAVGFKEAIVRRERVKEIKVGILAQQAWNDIVKYGTADEIGFLTALDATTKGLDNQTRAYTLMAYQAGVTGAATEETQKDFSSTLSEALSYAQELGDYQDQRAVLEQELYKARRWGYSEWGSKIRGIKGDLKDLDQAHEEAMLNWIADAYQAQLATDGVFDDQDMMKVLNYKKEMGLLSQEEYNAALKALGLKKALESLPTNIDITVTEWINLQTTGHTGSGQTGGRSTTVRTQASGGDLNKGGWTLVGDAPGGQLTPYSELISPTGHVFNAKETRQLVAAGLHPTNAMYAGGVGYGDDPYGMPLTSEQQAYNDAWYAAATGGSSGGSGKKRTRAMATVSTAVNAAATDLRAASLGISQQSEQAAQIGAQGNQISKQILQAIDALPERLAAKMAQGRL